MDPKGWNDRHYDAEIEQLRKELLESCNDLKDYLDVEFPEYRRKYPSNRSAYEAQLATINYRIALANGDDVN